MEIIRNKATIQCVGCLDIRVLSADMSDAEIKIKLDKEGWIFDDYNNQFCTSICQAIYQRDCEHDNKYKMKLEDTVVCINCGKDFGGIIE